MLEWRENYLAEIAASLGLSQKGAEKKDLQVHWKVAKEWQIFLYCYFYIFNWKWSLLFFTYYVFLYLSFNYSMSWSSFIHPELCSIKTTCYLKYVCNLCFKLIKLKLFYNAFWNDFFKYFVFSKYSKYIYVL